MSLLKELARRIWHWFTLCECQAEKYTCCSDVGKDDKEQEKEPEQKKGGFAY